MKVFWLLISKDFNLTIFYLINILALDQIVLHNILKFYENTIKLKNKEIINF